MKQDISFDVKQLVPPEIYQLFPDTSVRTDIIPEIKKEYFFNLDSTIQAETDGNFSLSNLKSAKFKQLKFILPGDTEVNEGNIEAIRITAKANDGSAPYIVEQFNNFTITTDSVNQKKNLYITNLDTQRDVIDQLKASAVEYTVFAKFKDSLLVRLKDQYKMEVSYVLTVKK